MTSAYETFPELRALEAALHGLDIRAREVFGSDVSTLRLHGSFDLALAPRCPLPEGLGSQPLRVGATVGRPPGLGRATQAARA